MNNKEGYDQWAASYDEMINKTRDLEAIILREIVSAIPFSQALEIGCGTGKNTKWISEHAYHVTAVDFSSEMVNKAKQKIGAGNVDFRQADIRTGWDFADHPFDLITASLILEHVQDLNHIFHEAHKVLKAGGYFYFGELHPFKQYEGSKARFERDGETIVLDCFIHHVSDYFLAAINNNFECVQLKECFDDDQSAIPRLLSMLFRKN